MCPSHHCMAYLHGVLRSVLLVLLVLPHLCLAVSGARFRVGLVGPWQCDPLFAKALPAVAAQLAVSHVNGDPSLSHAQDFEYAVLQEPCETSKALEAYLGFHTKASGFIGPINPGYCDAASLVGKGWNKPLFSWSCVGTELDDVHSHPTFAHSMPRPAQVLRNLMHYFRWAHVGIISSSQDIWVETATKLSNSLRGHGMPVRMVAFIENTSHGVKRTLDKVRKMGDMRLVVLCMHSALLGGSLQKELLETAYDMQMIDGSLAFVPYDTLLYSLPYRNVTHAALRDSARLLKAYDAVLTVTVDSPGTSFYEALAGAVQRGEVSKTLMPQQVSPLFGTIYSSIVLMAHAVQGLRESGDRLSGGNLARHARNLTFQGFSHPIKTSVSGAAMVNYLVLDTDGLSWELKPTYMIDMEVNLLRFLGREIHFPSGHGPSKDHSCWFTKGVICSGGIDVYESTGIILGPLLSSVFAVALIYGIRRSLRMMRSRSKMILTLADVTFINPSLYNRKSADESRASGGVSEIEHSVSSISILTPPNPENSSVVVYEGDWAWVRKLPVGSFTGVTLKTRDVFKLMKDLHHENINPFLAFFYDCGVFATVTEFASRGSLEDLTLNEDVKLDWMFKYSLLMDLIKGLKYLHNKGLCHGRLKSRNCVVDGRFVLKVTDYGFRTILEGHGFPCPEPAPEELLWTAPELLRMGHPMPSTPAGDVYSFSIIVQELLSRGRPYFMLNLSVTELLERLCKPPPLCRPVLSPDYAPGVCIELMKRCWHEHPEKRPNFEEIFDLFKDINQGMKYNIIDSMLRMLEQYSSNLAELITERTEELEFEKQKTERLLTQMLPPSVADVLKVGGTVEPEHFDSVSLYFSDIVGFTTISANSEPIEVVDLLNDLYTVFDAIIGDHDVYKVETIGDAYMVASGLPVRKEKHHAAEIANMSLDILSAVGTFKMRHMPDVPIRIRIGLHSGPCVAGVVGLTMPRYCLFGDTVTTASRMESSGMPQRIQVHESTVKILMDLKMGYKVQLRGKTEVKGEQTYWLTGRDGFTKPLPVPPEIKSKQMAQKLQMQEIANHKKKKLQKQQQLAKKK